MGWSPFRKTGLTHYQPEHCFNGYTLFAPVGNDDLVLLNMEGQIVKQWLFEGLSPSLARFRPNGNLIVNSVSIERRAAANDKEKDDYSNPDLVCLTLGGGTTTLREYDWDGNLLWQYDNPRMHHDFFECENGDILFPEWVVLPEALSQKVQGGYRKAPKRPYMFGDDIVRINRAGEEVGRWHTWQMLDPVEDPIVPQQSRAEWTHMNSVAEMPDGQLVASLCENSRVILIDPAQTAVTWKMGEPEISMQHHASPVNDGNIQIFDNGRNRPLSLPYSQVIEVDPRTDEIVWRYKPKNMEQFFSGHISGAQRLPNSNVLICEGTGGRLFEVTPAGEIVWEWITPIIGTRSEERHLQWIYRANRYAAGHPALVGKDLNPQHYAELNEKHGLAKN